MVKPGRILFEVVSRDNLLVKDVLSFTLRKFPMAVQVVSKELKIK
jgi:hypothetical protein